MTAPEDCGPPPEVVLHRLRAEFTEMPGLMLTAAQAERLCAAPRSVCEWALHELMHEGLLRRTRNDAFVRA
jgi:hypothetical protein